MLQREEMDTGNQYRTSAGTGRFLHSRKSLSPPPWDKAGLLLEFWEIKESGIYFLLCLEGLLQDTPACDYSDHKMPPKKGGIVALGLQPRLELQPHKKNHLPIPKLQ